MRREAITSIGTSKRGDLRISSNLIASLSLANGQRPPPGMWIICGVQLCWRKLPFYGSALFLNVLGFLYADRPLHNGRGMMGNQGKNYSAKWVSKVRFFDDSSRTFHFQNLSQHKKPCVPDVYWMYTERVRLPCFPGLAACTGPSTARPRLVHKTCTGCILNV